MNQMSGCRKQRSKLSEANGTVGDDSEDEAANNRGFLSDLKSLS